MLLRQITVAGALAGLGLSSQIHAQQASFTPIGTLPGGDKSYAAAISADGSTVVGTSYKAGREQAFRWKTDGSLIGLGFLETSTQLNTSSAFSLSDDGSVIVGFGWKGSFAAYEAFRWTASTGMKGIARLPGGQSISAAQSVSGDGKVIVGNATGAVQRPLRWTNEGSTLTELSGVLPANGSGYAKAVNLDGSVIAGMSVAGWITSDGGVTATPIPDLPGGGTSMAITDMNNVGDLVVGWGNGTNGSEAIIWTPSGGTKGIGDLPGGGFKSAANACSFNGVVVGMGRTAQGDEAFVYLPDRGMLNLREMLMQSGVDLTGWRLREATGVSADGTKIVGEAIDPVTQDSVGFIAVIPEPQLGLLVLLPCFAFKRRHSFSQQLPVSSR